MGYGGMLNRESVEKGAVVANYPVADGYSINKGDVVDVVNGEVVSKSEVTFPAIYSISDANTGSQSKLFKVQNSVFLSKQAGGVGYLDAESKIAKVLSTNNQNLVGFTYEKELDGYYTYFTRLSGNRPINGVIYKNSDNYGTVSLLGGKTAESTDFVYSNMVGRKFFYLFFDKGFIGKVSGTKDVYSAMDFAGKNILDMFYDGTYCYIFYKNSDNRVYVKKVGEDVGSIKDYGDTDTGVTISANRAYPLSAGVPLISCFDKSNNRTCFIFKQSSSVIKCVVFDSNFKGTEAQFSFSVSNFYSLELADDKFVCLCKNNSSSTYAIVFEADFSVPSVKFLNYTLLTPFEANKIYFVTFGCSYYKTMEEIYCIGLNYQTNQYVVLKTKLLPNGMIGDSITYTSTQAIALNSGTAGQNIDIVYSGLVEYEASKDTKIESNGVFGYVPVENVLDVSPWYFSNLELKATTGSYTGTGEYGKDHPVKITFPFEPMLLIVAQKDNDSRLGEETSAYWWKGNTELMYVNSNVGIQVIKNTISWFDNSSASNQFNATGTPYTYFALGC